METTETKTSRYNSGIAQIYRMDDLWKKTHQYSSNGQLFKWNITLDRVWCELARDLKENKFKEKQKMFDELNTKIGSIVDNPNNSFENPTLEYQKLRYKQYNLLMEKDLFLRRLENELGKGTAWEDDMEDYMD